MPKTLVSLAVLCLMTASTATALDWSDDSFRVQYGTAYREPGVTKADGSPQDVAKTTLNYTHASGDRLGGHFLSVDMYLSDSKDPAQGSPQGATEVYVVYRRGLSLNKIFDTKAFTFTAVRDVQVDAGIDIGTKNNSFASHKAAPTVGVALAFDVPGFWNLGAYLTKEWNNNGISGKQVTFDAAPVLSTSWGIGLGSLPLQFTGFANVLFPKGNDGFGAKTVTEILLQPKLVWDVPQTFSGKKSGWELGIGYQYWKNKFGNDNAKVAGSLASTVFFEAAVHL
jgi:hypothetical protein